MPRLNTVASNVGSPLRHPVSDAWTADNVSHFLRGLPSDLPQLVTKTWRHAHLVCNSMTCCCSSLSRSVGRSKGENSPDTPLTVRLRSLREE
jgi:hypothetical protein